MHVRKSWKSFRGYLMKKCNTEGWSPRMRKSVKLTSVSLIGNAKPHNQKRSYLEKRICRMIVSGIDSSKKLCYITIKPGELFVGSKKRSITCYNVLEALLVIMSFFYIFKSQ